MNTKNLINCLYPNLKAVQVVFNGRNTTEYTYKTFDTYEIGDKCIVESPYGGCVAVTVVGTDSSRLEEDYRFKWVVQRIDPTAYLEQCEKEATAMQELSRMVMDNRRKDAIGQLQEIVGIANLAQLKKLINASE